VEVDGTAVGEITGYDDSTENVLLIVETPQKTVYVPVAPEFFVNIDHDGKVLTMDLPVGLLDM
jgi:ribosomal 30S subunit maturation factor RimM